MGKHRNATKEGRSKHKDASPFHHLMEESCVIHPRMWWNKQHHRQTHPPRHPLDSHNHMDHPLHAPYHLSIDRPTQQPQMIGCIIATTEEWLLGREGVINPHLPMHGVDHWYIARCLPGILNHWSCGPSTKEAILFFRKCSFRERLLYCNAQDIELGLRGQVNWAWKTLQVEVTINTVQEGHRAIVDAIMEKKMIASGPGCPQGLDGATQPSDAACNVNDWMQCLDEGTSDR